MADFVAVIRRAVDGLANNTPEARVRVYDKARGAVQRQLENMKPRPPEEMLRRQLDKLEAAITEVETEHSEALPADPAPVVAPIPVAAPVETYDEPAPAAYEAPAAPVAAEAEAPVSATEPVVPDEPALPAAEEPAYVEPETYEAPAPVAAAPADDEDWRHEPPAAEPVDEPRHAWEEPEPVSVAPEVSPQTDVPQQERYGDWRDDVPEEREQPVPAVPAWATIGNEQASAFEREREEIKAEPAQDHDQVWPSEATSAPDVAAEPWNAPEPEPAVPAEPVAHYPDDVDRTRADAAWDDVGDLAPAQEPQAIPEHSTPYEPAYEPPHLPAGSGEPVAAHFDQEIRATAEPVRMPSAADLPDFPAAPAGRGEADPFEAYVNSQPQAVEAGQAGSKKDDKDPWSDLEDLIGYTKEAPAAQPKSEVVAAPTATEASETSEDDLSDLLSPPAKPYRVTPKPKRNYAGMVLGILALCLLGGAGYAFWVNRDALNDIVGGLMETTSGEQTADAPASGTPSGEQAATAPQTPPAQTPPTQTPPAQGTAASPQTGTPPPADGSAGSKFTQRLTQDGSEVDEGPGEMGALAQNAEGQSVAQLNTPPADPGAAAPAGAPGVTAPNAPASTPATTPAAAGERMFLYEERIGQSAPTAIEGSVSWSLQREPAPNGGAPEPVVQGRITIPERGLTALVSVKRNTDSSLPASHLIEIVFAVPSDFEGGAIDSVLRIAMKQTEQDRGNALVAVPAKITDDFHMIALNDFPDARATNLELMRSRDWMDIPVAYRNGRRALLTLQKGPEGKAAFDEAIREWNQQSGQ